MWKGLVEVKREEHLKGQRFNCLRLETRNNAFNRERDYCLTENKKKLQ